MGYIYVLNSARQTIKYSASFHFSTQIGFFICIAHREETHTLSMLISPDRIVKIDYVAAIYLPFELWGIYV